MDIPISLRLEPETTMKRLLKAYYDELMDLGKELEENENHFFAKKYLKYFGTVADRADRLLGRCVHLLDYANQVRDSYQEKVVEQQNKNMPELEQGYPGVIVLSLIVVAAIIVVFKKKKIL